MDKFVFEGEIDDSTSGKSFYTFGCAKTETNMFYTQKADGIIGFGAEKYRSSNSLPPNIIEAEYQRNWISTRSFSMCLGRKNGMMTLGQWDPTLNITLDANQIRRLEADPKENSTKTSPEGDKAAEKEPNSDNINPPIAPPVNDQIQPQVQPKPVDPSEDAPFFNNLNDQDKTPKATHQDPIFKTNEISTSSFGSNPWHKVYKVPLYSIDLSGEKIDYKYDQLNKGLTSGEGAFFDSGTTFLYVSSELMAKLKKTFKTFCSKSSARCGGYDDYQDCYKIKPKYKGKVKRMFWSFPVINFDFKTPDLYKWYPSDYLVKNGSNIEYCPGIKVLKDIILGAAFMRNYNVKFDKNKKVISFQRADCAETGDVDTYDDMSEGFWKLIDNFEVLFLIFWEIYY